MAEFRCGTCGWTAHSITIAGMLAASEAHEREGCNSSEEAEQ